MNKLINIRQLWLLITALFREIIREPGVLFWGVLFPVLMALGLGIAFAKKGDVIRKIAIIDSMESDSLIQRNPSLTSFLNKSCEINTVREDSEWKWKYVIKDEKLGNSVFLFYEMEAEEAMMLLKRGTFNVLLSSENDKTGYHFDPMNSDAELTYLKLSSIIGEGRVLSVEGNSVIRPLTVKGTRYIDFLVPGLIAMGVMMSSMWGISYGIIEKRSKKLLRRMVATPMKKSHFLVALISVRFAMNAIEALILLVFALVAFKMTIQGDIMSLIMIFIAGNIAFSGLAILISSHTSNTEVGNGIINFVVTPMMVLSGIFFSYQNFPEWTLPVIRNLPLTMLSDGMRSIFNEGAGFAQVIKPVIVLTTTGIIFFGAGLKIFKWH